MKKLIGKFFFFIAGWKLDARIESEMRHSLMIAAPHTSNWDFVWTLAAFWNMGLPFRYFIKDQYTRSVFGWFFKWSGAIGVNREQRSNLVDYAIQLLRENDELVILITPEGSRKYVEKCRMGFYHIARGAHVPITLGYIHYGKKIAGVGGLIHLTDNIEKDLDKIEAFYKDKQGKYPENWNPKIH